MLTGDKQRRTRRCVKEGERAVAAVDEQLESSLGNNVTDHCVLLQITLFQLQRMFVGLSSLF